MRERKSELKQAASQKSVKVAEVILTDLVNVTPVDSSQALSNWQVALSSPVQTRIDAYYFGQRGSTQELSAVAAMAAARAVLKNKRPGQDIVISNVLPYIKRLNDGYSAQAPAGFVERAILIGRLEADKPIVGIL